MYLFALLDYRTNQLVDFPNKCLKNKDKYSNKGFVNQKTEDFDLAYIITCENTEIVLDSEIITALQQLSFITESYDTL